MEQVESSLAEDIEDIRIRLRLTVCVCRYDSRGAYHEEFLARYGVCGRD
jgi:hypothetical protein